MQPYFFLDLLTYTRDIVTVVKDFHSRAGEKSLVAKAGISCIYVSASSVIPAETWILCTLIDIFRERKETKLHQINNCAVVINKGMEQDAKVMQGQEERQGPIICMLDTEKGKSLQSVK